LPSLLILAGDGKPMLFRQKRIGKNGNPFLILKFCTMRPGNGAADPEEYYRTVILPEKLRLNLQYQRS
jgi:lipopolysaccharide/colanic/teichoic acid biosynthesis glycosyltransferase